MAIHRIRLRRAAMLGGIAGIAAATHAHQTINVRVIAATDQRPPRIPDSWIWRTSFAPTVADDGKATFGISLIQQSAPNGLNGGPVRGTALDDLVLVYQRTDQPPGLAPPTFTDFQILLPLTAGDGLIAFDAELAGPGVTPLNSAGIWRERAPGDLELVVREGDIAPDTSPPATFVDQGFRFGWPGDFPKRGLILTRNGHIAFFADVNTNPATVATTEGIWFAPAGEPLRQLAIDGGIAPGYSPPAIFWFDGLGPEVVINDRGDAVLYAQFTSRQFGGLFTTRDAGTLERLLEDNEPIPGEPDDLVIRAVAQAIAINNTGRIYFGASVRERTAAPWDPAIGTVMVHDPNDGLGVLFRNDSLTPGLPTGVRIAVVAFPGPLVASSTGQLAFNGSLDGPGIDSSNDETLWLLDEHEGLWLALREGSQAPGLDPGVVVGQVRRTPALNALGHFAVTTEITGPGVTDDNDVVLWVGQYGLGIVPALREGDIIDANNGVGTPDPRTIDFIYPPSPSGGEDGRLLQLNDRGDLVVGVELLDWDHAVLKLSMPSFSCNPADLSSPGKPGIPDGLLTDADFFEFLARFAAGDLSIDFSSPNNPGQPDGLLTGADFFEFLNLFAAGC